MDEKEKEANKWLEVKRGVIEKWITDAYTEAKKDVDEQIDRYVNGWNEAVTDENGIPKLVHHAGMNERYKEEYAAYKAGFYHDETGVYTDAQVFNRWWYSQEKRLNHLEAMNERIGERLTQAGTIARAYARDELPEIYAKGYNGVVDIVQKSAMQKGITGIRFDLIDDYTAKAVFNGKANDSIKRLKFDSEIDRKWNITKLQNAIHQGVLQGDDIGSIADRLQSVVTMSRKTAVCVARTATTAAYNVGKFDRWQDLKKQGVYISKTWNDVHDHVPPERIQHWEASGQTVESDKLFEVGGEFLAYPCDMSHGASGWNVYDCRCVMNTGGIEFKSILPQASRGHVKRVIDIEL